MKLRIANISLKNAVMPKEFYWNCLRIDNFNEVLSNVQSNEPKFFEISVPQMPLNSTPFNITFFVENLSESELELKIFKRTSCDCSVMQNRRRKEQQLKPKCPHKSLADLRPASENIKGMSMIQLEMICRYVVVGQHDITFHIVSNQYVVKLKLIAVISEFNPMTMLLTNELSPVAIDKASSTKQALWLFNPYSNDIGIKLISYDDNLSFNDEEIVIKSQNHAVAFVEFLPFYVGRYEMEIGILFNECECITKIHAECTACDVNALYERGWLTCNSPNYDIPSQLNPFVIHGDNLCIVIPQNGLSNENIIGLQNNSKHCIKYEWEKFDSLDLTCDVRMQPQIGYLKAGFTKLFHVTVKSTGCAAQMHLIPMKCKIYRYDNQVFREYMLPDGYFEYTDKGYYEKPQNWLPKCFELTHTLYVNMNIKILDHYELLDILDNSTGKCEDNSKILHWLNSSNGVAFEKTMQHHMNVNYDKDCEQKINDDEKCIMEILISAVVKKLKVKNGNVEKSDCKSFSQKYQAVEESNERFKDMQQRSFYILLQVMNDMMFDVISEISREHRFLPSSC